MECKSLAASSTFEVHETFPLPAVYLALSLPPVVFPTRQVLDFWLPGRIDKRPLLRKLFLLTVITVIMLLVGLLAASSSGQVRRTGAASSLIGSCQEQEQE